MKTTIIINWIEHDIVLTEEQIKEITKTKNDTAYNGMYVGDEGNWKYRYVDASNGLRDWDWNKNKWFSFEKKEDVEKRAKKMKAIKNLWRRSAENDPRWGVWRVYFDQNRTRYSANNLGECVQNILPEYSTTEKAAQAMNECKKDFLDYFQN